MFYLLLILIQYFKKPGKKSTHLTIDFWVNPESLTAYDFLLDFY